ncbi:MAG TPA: hypothetical protein IAC14_09535 [Candidatus Scybalomonas excrementigallinarum]|nr:hypothetical protein [Candidatus Scybalomonas excrementigallinarum]
MEQEVVEEPEQPDPPTDPTDPEEPELPEEPVEENGSFDIGFIYYEYLEDKNGVLDDTFYYHGIGGKQSDNPYDKSQYTELRTQKKGKYLVNGLSRKADTYVREEGYLLLVHKSVDISELRVKIAYDTKKIEELFDAKEISLPKELEDFQAYIFKENRYFTSSIPSVIVGKLIDKTKPWIGIKEELGFSLNPSFGDSIKFIGEPVDATTYYIRSTRHLSNLTSSDYRNIVDSNRAKNKFIQTLDIDVDRVVNGKKQEISTIQNFWATYSSESYLDNSAYYKIIGLKTPLFSMIHSDALVENITLKEMMLTNTSYLFASNNQGTITNVTIEDSTIQSDTAIYGFVKDTVHTGKISKITMNNITMKSEKEINGFGDSFSSGSLEEITLSNMEIESEETINGFIKQSIVPVSHISITNMKMNGKNGVNGFADSLNGGSIEDIEFSGIQLESNGMINGFIKQSVVPISNISITDIKMNGISGVNGFANQLSSGSVSQVTLSDIEMESKEVVNGFVSTASISLSNIFMTNMKMTGTNGLNGFADHLGGATVKQIELFNIQMISESEVNPFVQSAGGTSLSNISMKKLIIQDSNGTTEEDFEIP